MDKVSEFQDALTATLRRMSRPKLFLPVILLVVVPAFAFLTIASSMLGTLRGQGIDPSNLSRTSLGEGFGFLAIGLLLCIPAAMSGLVSLAKAAVERDSASWSDFYSGLGRYYGRIFGAYALAMVATMVLGVPLGLAVVSSRGAPVSPFAAFFVQGIILVGEYFLTLWMAAMALDGTGVFKSVESSIQFAWRYPRLLVPAFIAQTVIDYVVGLADVEGGLSQGSVVLGGARIAQGVLVGGVQAFLFMFFMVLYFDLYRRRMAPAVLAAPAGLGLPAGPAVPLEPEPPVAREPQSPIRDDEPPEAD